MGIMQVMNKDKKMRHKTSAFKSDILELDINDINLIIDGKELMHGGLVVKFTDNIGGKNIDMESIYIALTDARDRLNGGTCHIESCLRAIKQQSNEIESQQ